MSTDNKLTQVSDATGPVEGKGLLRDTFSFFTLNFLNEKLYMPYLCTKYPSVTFYTRELITFLIFSLLCMKMLHAVKIMLLLGTMR